MGIYIPGMEMPEKIEPGLVIEFADGIDGKRYARLHHYRYGGLTDWLEAVPVPPHGDLIDRDKFRETMFIGEQCLYSWDEIEDAIDYAPTIIPPSEEGE